MHLPNASRNDSEAGCFSRSRGETKIQGAWFVEAMDGAGHIRTVSHPPAGMV